MMLVAATPIGALLTVFGAVPLLIVIAIYGSEGATSLRQRHWPPKH